MAGITDTERGARMAQEAALYHLHPDLFGYEPEVDALWQGIFTAAARELEDATALRQAMRA